MSINAAIIQVYNAYFSLCRYPSRFAHLSLSYHLFLHNSISAEKIVLPEAPDAAMIQDILNWPEAMKKEPAYKSLLHNITCFLKTPMGIALALERPLVVGALDAAPVSAWAEPLDLDARMIEISKNERWWGRFCETYGLPEFLNIPLLGVTRIYPKELYRYPGDCSDHQAEAKKIFLSTLFERIKGTLFDSRANFFRKKQIDSDNYKHDLPIDFSKGKEGELSSYWIGHASCLLNVPVESVSEKIKLRILIDPVEHALHPLFYRRQTKPGSLIEELPSIDVILISHDHRDHLDEATLKKLVVQQPLMIVPKGTYGFFKSMGFQKITEILPGQKVDIKRNNLRVATVNGVKAKHWTGRLMHDAHASAFLSFIIQSNALEGDIYFAGDTALLNARDVEMITQHFDVRYSFQPGGPDENRSEMESTHQSSADGLLMHMRFLDAALSRQKKQVSKEELISLVKTIYMHTKTFKLGNLHHDDTDLSVERILSALNAIKTYAQTAEGIDIEAHPGELIFIQNLESYEYSVLIEILKIIYNISTIEGRLTPQDVANLFESAVRIPRVGECTTLSAPIENLGLLEHALIINQKALEDCLEVGDKKDEVARVIALFEQYHTHWWHHLSREHMTIVKHTIQEMKKANNIDEIKKILDMLAGLVVDKSGHLSGYLNYCAKLISTQRRAVQKTHRAKEVLNLHTAPGILTSFSNAASYLQYLAFDSAAEAAANLIVSTENHFEKWTGKKRRLEKLPEHNVKRSKY